MRILENDQLLSKCFTSDFSCFHSIIVQLHLRISQDLGVYMIIQQCLFSKNGCVPLSLLVFRQMKSTIAIILYLPEIHANVWKQFVYRKMSFLGCCFFFGICDPKTRDQHSFTLPLAAEREVHLAQHWVGLNTTIPGDMFNIPLRTSDIFFCMKSDICSVNILQPPLCKKIKKEKKNILYSDQENYAWKAFHYRGCYNTDGPWELKKSNSDPYRFKTVSMRSEKQ